MRKLMKNCPSAVKNLYPLDDAFSLEGSRFCGPMFVFEDSGDRHRQLEVCFSDFGGPSSSQR